MKSFRLISSPVGAAAAAVCLLMVSIPHSTAAVKDSFNESDTNKNVKPTTILLWPGGAPGAKGESYRDKPSLTIYLADKEKANGAAVVICPGGGYGGLAIGHEGHEIAKWLNSFGVSAFILTYRHHGTGYGHPHPMWDVQRAIRTVRSGADKYKIDAKRIGVLGFSAGGHLASTAATHFDGGQKDAKNKIDRVGCRPDFAILCYAVITMQDDYTHGGSKRNLLGSNPDKKLVELLSNEKQITANTPPTFLWSTSDDGAVPVQNSIQFYLALRKAKVPVEMHIYETGRHGLGLAKNVSAVSSWPKRCEDWMRSRKLLGK